MWSINVKCDYDINDTIKAHKILWLKATVP